MSRGFSLSTEAHRHNVAVSACDVASDVYGGSLLAVTDSHACHRQSQGHVLFAMSLTAGSRVVVASAAGVLCSGSPWAVGLVCVSDVAGWIAGVVTDDVPFVQVEPLRFTISSVVAVVTSSAVSVPLLSRGCDMVDLISGRGSVSSSSVGGPLSFRPGIVEMPSPTANMSNSSLRLITRGARISLFGIRILSVSVYQFLEITSLAS